MQCCFFSPYFFRFGMLVLFSIQTGNSSLNKQVFLTFLVCFRWSSILVNFLFKQNEVVCYVRLVGLCQFQSRKKDPAFASRPSKCTRMQQSKFILLQHPFVPSSEKENTILQNMSYQTLINSMKMSCMRLDYLVHAAVSACKKMLIT